MSKQSDIVKVSQDAGTTGFVNASGDTMTGNLSTTGNIKATNGFLAGANNTYLYEGASNILNIRIGETGPYAEFVDAGSNVLKIGNASGRLSLTSNGIERVHLDDAGRVTMPYQPAFSAFFSVSSPTPYTAGSRVLNFTTVSYNVGNHYDGTNKFTAPVAGRYVFLVNRALNTYGANQVIRHPSMGFDVNGTTNYGVNTGVSTSSAVGSADYTHFTVSMATVLNLNANDYVQVNFNYANSPSILYEYSSSWFTGYLLG